MVYQWGVCEVMKDNPDATLERRILSVHLISNRAPGRWFIRWHAADNAVVEAYMKSRG